MQEDLVILLEWLSANGITELFNNSVCNLISSNENEFKKTVGRDTVSTIKALARQQEEIKEFNLISDNTYRIKEIADKLTNLNNLKDIINSINFYKNFIKAANNTLVFSGEKYNNILIINDLPNDDDDINGKFFSGESGDLLSNMFKAINVELEDCCFMNTFYWRLAGNRSPIKEELNLCKPFNERIISLINPRLIVFTGNYGVSNLYEDNSTLAKIRGKFLDYTNCYLQNKIKITGLYNPSFLLKNQIKKKDAWQDLQKIQEFLNNY